MKDAKTKTCKCDVCEKEIMENAFYEIRLYHCYQDMGAAFKRLDGDICKECLMNYFNENIL